jgi:hypothetical protein
VGIGGQSIKATKVGSLKRQIFQLDGSSVNVTLNEISYVLKLWMIFSRISKALKDGFDLINQGLMISLNK